MLMIIAFNCGIIDTNKPFMIQIFGTQRYMLEKKTLGNGSTSQPRHLILVDLYTELSRQEIGHTSPPT